MDDDGVKCLGFGDERSGKMVLYTFGYFLLDPLAPNSGDLGWRITMCGPKSAQSILGRGSGETL